MKIARWAVLSGFVQLSNWARLNPHCSLATTIPPRSSAMSPMKIQVLQHLPVGLRRSPNSELAIAMNFWIFRRILGSY